MNNIEYQRLIAFHPGQYINNYLSELGISQEELAKRMQTTPKHINDLLNGRCNLTPALIFKLANVFNTSTQLWLNLNKRFIKKQLEIETKIKIEY